MDRAQPQALVLNFQHLIFRKRTGVPYVLANFGVQLRDVRDIFDRSLDAMRLLLLRPLGIDKEPSAVIRQEDTQVYNCDDHNDSLTVLYSAQSDLRVHLQGYGHQFQRIRYLLVYS